MHGRRSLNKLTWPALLLLSSSLGVQASPPDVPEQYRRHFAHYQDKRSLVERSLNLVGWTNQDVGRSFALIAGVVNYPNMPLTERELEPAAEDLKKLEQYLTTFEFFDEIVVLKDQDMTFDNLQYFLQTYFPRRLRQFPKSRFLFAYSGHGTSEGANGYLLKNTARSLDDKDNALPLKIVRDLFDEVVNSGHHTLALINACYSGNFLKRSFGDRRYIPRHPGAHAITAGGSGELTWHDPEVGTGSIFFEKFFAGLYGRADAFPKNDDGSSGDGMVTVDELAAYLRQEIQIFTDQKQNPQAGDISRDGSLGSFFFLDRQRQVEAQTVREWKPDSGRAYGTASAKTAIKGKEYYRTGDYESAARSFSESAEGGNPEAMLRLGMMYVAGQGVDQDYEQGARWLRSSAVAGNGSAMYNLGVMYFHGRGVKQDFEKARRWLLDGAQAGSAPAMASLGLLYQEGRGVTRDFDTARKWYERGAEAGVASAMTGLAHLYHKGLGVQQDFDKALQWYGRGAEAGNATAMANLGLMYAGGQGVKQDHREAKRWFEQGAEAGEPAAMIGLGLMYENGQGVTKSLNRAKRWYRKAAAAGNEWAEAHLRELD